MLSDCITHPVCLQCLEDVGIRMTRFAGSSIGATIAALLAVGYTSDELVTLYIQDLSMFIRGRLLHTCNKYTLIYFVCPIVDPIVC